jgi:hypothetical protein
LSIETTHDDGSRASVGVTLDARKTWSIGGHLRDAAGAYLDAGGTDDAT